MQERRSSLLGESLFSEELPSGAKFYAVPKKGYVEKQAMITVNYGSADNKYTLDGEEREIPQGVAHFLEHKMFEDDETPVLEKFTSLGANVNAFTTYTHTTYYFNCIDRFDECLEALAGAVQKPHFTDENVEKEKGIIAQEIRMYADSPSWRVYMNLHKALYHNGPIRDNIAGSTTSIERIDKGLLFECYNAFYHPSNMSAVVVGDIDPSKVSERLSWMMKPRAADNVVRIRDREPDEANMSYIEEKMAVSMPCFQFGFKESDFSCDMATKIASSKILADLLAGESSPLFGELYDEGLLDESFSRDYLCGSFYGTTIFSGASRNPIEFRKRLLAEIERVNNKGIDPIRFAAIKRKHIGRYVRSFNMVSHIAMNQVDLCSKGLGIMDLMDAFESVSIEDVQGRLKLLTPERSALSIVSPLERAV
ncbi:MAG: insulinase family protein [Clostridiales bacterium]|jgi:predicted Zn-dependent peptidase|nr:insulinase family protein [Clostridiales bacterium]